MGTEPIGSDEKTDHIRILNRNNKSRINAEEMRFLKRIEDKTRTDKIGNEVIREEVPVPVKI